MIDVMYCDSDSVKPYSKNTGLNHNELVCLETMLGTYRIILATADAGKQTELAIACSMLKDFLGYCYVNDMISDDDYEYIRRQDIVTTVSGHKAFYDILKRKYLSTKV